MKIWDEGGAQEILEKKLRKGGEPGHQLEAENVGAGPRDGRNLLRVTAEATPQDCRAGMGRAAGALELALVGMSLPRDVLLVTHQLCHLPAKRLGQIA